MVKYQPQLDHVFAALASTTRRQILAQLERTDGQSVSDLANSLGMKLPAMLKCGRFRVRFRMRNGSEHECSGEVLELVRPARLVTTWRWNENEGEAPSQVP